MDVFYMHPTDILKNKLIALVEEINNNTKTTISFNQQSKKKENMSLSGGNGRMWIQPSPEGYDISLSGISLEKNLTPYMEKLFGKPCDGYKQTNNNIGIIRQPYWRTDSFKLVSQAAYEYSKTVK